MLPFLGFFMEFNEAKDRIILQTPEDFHLAWEVVDASRYEAEGKERPLHTKPKSPGLPIRLGAAASNGLMACLERAAEDYSQKLDVTPETRDSAWREVVKLNDEREAQRDSGLLGRLAVAISQFDIKLPR